MIYLCAVHRQVYYIIQAFLLLLLLPIIFLTIKLALSENNFGNTNAIIDYDISREQNPVSEIFTKGQSLFRAKCAACHVLFKDMTGPDLTGFEERGPWAERKNVYAWIRNPSAFIKKNEYAKELRSIYKTTMTVFPDLTDEEIDSICEYIKQAGKMKSLPAF